MVRERGSLVDADAKRRGIRQLDFEQRWTTEIKEVKLAAKVRHMAVKKSKEM